MHFSETSEEEAKGKIEKASKVGVVERRYWEKSQINYEKSEWHLTSQQQDYKKEDGGVIPLKFLQKNDRHLVGLYTA